MNMQDVKAMDKDAFLGLLGLQTKHSGSRQVVEVLGTLGIGVVVGAAAALLFAPKSGSDLRHDLRAKMRGYNNGVTMNGNDGVPAGDSFSQRAREL